MKKAIKWIILALVVALVVMTAVWYFAIYDNDYIGRNEAKAAALSDAGFAASEVKGMDVDFEKEDGYAYYEVKFVKDAIEYEYYIDAYAGTVQRVETESVFD